VKDQLEPELSRMVHDDEQELIRMLGR
jgi:hypothetical protein